MSRAARNHNHGDSRGYVSVLAGGAVATPIVHNDRRVDVRSVKCPVCGCEPGDPCISSTGKVTNHPSRRRMALRAETETYDSRDVYYARELGCGGRRTARADANLNRHELAVLLNVTVPLLGRWERGDAIPSGPAGARYGAWLRAQLEAAAS